MDQKRVNLACKKFQKTMQKIVDDSKGNIDGITLQIGNEKPITIAEKKKPK